MWKRLAAVGTSMVGAVAVWWSFSSSTPERFFHARCADTSVDIAVQKSRQLVQRVMAEQGIPGAVVCVAVDGEEAWSEGLGYADLENGVHCSPQTVMRIASISKSLSAVAVLQLWERGLLDLDTPVQSYVPEFPLKTYNGSAVEVTCRQLLSHQAGIRHYQRAAELEGGKGEFQNEEYFIREHYSSVKDALELFASDDLVSAPGLQFHYTTHGWTLLSAAVEGASGSNFLDYLQSHILSPLGMASTVPERHGTLTYHRARHYTRSTGGVLLNSPYVDNSYKWAGGGILSSAPDLVRFGSALLLCYQSSQARPGRGSPPLLLQPDTVGLMWTEVVRDISFSSNPSVGYGMGWVVRREDERVRGGLKEPFCVGHTGAAVGASSVLVITPRDRDSDEQTVPRGVVVAVIFNLQEVKGMFSLGSQIATHFLHSSKQTPLTD